MANKFKFQIGDRVEVSCYPDNCAAVFVGDTGTIVDIDCADFDHNPDNPMYTIERDSDGYRWYCMESRNALALID